jgi:RNA polymerase sigma-70 factor (ECF subfamily)
LSVDIQARTKAADLIDRLRPSIAAAQRGDQAAFRLIYQEYARSVYNLVFRCVRNPQASEDVCQEIWVKAFRELPKLHDPQAFPAWLYRIAARACVDTARQNRRLPATAELPDDRLCNTDDDPEHSALRRERVRLTWEALATMPARQHVALYLREIEKLSYKEIAQMVQSSEPAVEMLLFRARRGFAKAYDRLEGATQDRCLHARRSMAAILDGEATPVQRNAIRVHVDACSPCNGELTQMRRTAAAYTALLPLPVPALLGERIFEGIGAASAGASATPASVAKLFGLAAAKAKIAAITVVATAATSAATVAAMNSPIADEIRPGPSSSHSEIQTGDSALPTQDQPGASMTSDSTGTGADDDAPQVPAAEDQSGPLPLDPTIPGVTDTVDQLTAPVTSVVDETTADLNRSVDAILHDLEAITGEVPAVPPVEIDTPTIPTLPALPLPTPTIPSLPLLP